MVNRKKNKRTNKDLQHTTQKTNDQVTRHPLNIGGERRYSGSVNSSYSTSGTRLVTNPMTSKCCSCHCPVYMVIRFTSNVCEFHAYLYWDELDIIIVCKFVSYFRHQIIIINSQKYCMRLPWLFNGRSLLIFPCLSFKPHRLVWSSIARGNILLLNCSNWSILPYPTLDQSPSWTWSYGS